MTRRSLAVLLAIHAAAGCKQRAEITAEQGELRDELMAMTNTYQDQMCRCPDESCASKLDQRFRGWLAQMQRDIADSDQRNGTTAQTTEKWQTAFKAVLDRYDTCKIKIEIHRN